MSKIVLLADTHFGCRNDSIAFLEYQFKFYNNIFFPYLEKNNIKTVIHLGDITDRRKFINYVILNRFKNDFIFRLKRMGIDFHVIIGNHDVPFRNTNEINSMAELFGSDEGVSFPKYYSRPTTVDFDGTDICFMPWINNSNYTEAMQHIQSTRAQILLGHLEVAGFHMNKSMINDHGLQPKVFENFELVCSGHFHTKSNRGNIHYLGTPYEITWSDHNDPKGFHILDTETRELERVVNPHNMFHKIFYNDKDTTLEELTNRDFDAYQGTYVKVITIHKENPYWFDMFLDKVYKANPTDISIVDDHKNIHELKEDDIINEAEDTMTILHKYVDNLENMNVDKKKLTSLLDSLYTQALHTEV